MEKYYRALVIDKCDKYIVCDINAISLYRAVEYILDDNMNDIIEIKFISNFPDDNDVEEGIFSMYTIGDVKEGDPIKWYHIPGNTCKVTVNGKESIYEIDSNFSYSRNPIRLLPVNGAFSSGVQAISVLNEFMETVEPDPRNIVIPDPTTMLKGVLC